MRHGRTGATGWKALSELRQLSEVVLEGAGCAPGLAGIYMVLNGAAVSSLAAMPALERLRLPCAASSLARINSARRARGFQPVGQDPPQDCCHV